VILVCDALQRARVAQASAAPPPSPPLQFMADGGVGTGTAIRPATVCGYAEQAGFASCQIADIDHMLFRFYVLRAPD
jgi:hypothetical protein